MSYALSNSKPADTPDSLPPFLKTRWPVFRENDKVYVLVDELTKGEVLANAVRCRYEEATQLFQLLPRIAEVCTKAEVAVGLKHAGCGPTGWAFQLERFAQAKFGSSTADTPEEEAAVNVLAERLKVVYNPPRTIKEAFETDSRFLRFMGDDDSGEMERIVQANPDMPLSEFLERMHDAIVAIEPEDLETIDLPAKRKPN